MLTFLSHNTYIFLHLWIPIGLYRDTHYLRCYSEQSISFLRSTTLYTSIHTLTFLFNPPTRMMTFHHCYKVMNFLILCYSFLFCSFKMGSWKEGIQDIWSQFNLISGKPSCFFKFIIITISTITVIYPLN